jgi:hypothetical protein
MHGRRNNWFQDKGSGSLKPELRKKYLFNLTERRHFKEAEHSQPKGNVYNLVIDMINTIGFLGIISSSFFFFFFFK